MVKNQEEMIRLLRELTGRENRRPEDAGPFGGVRLPEASPPA